MGDSAPPVLAADVAPPLAADDPPVLAAEVPPTVAANNSPFMAANVPPAATAGVSPPTAANVSPDVNLMETQSPEHTELEPSANPVRDLKLRATAGGIN